MNRPAIRHLALYSRNPEDLAQFYHDVFEMEVIHRDADGSVFVSDGYLTLALLQHQMAGDAPLGLNHFGFHVADTARLCGQLVNDGLETPALRASKRPFAEYRAMDPEGNWFDLSAHGYGGPGPAQQ